MIKEMLTHDTIEVNVHAENWEEAVQLAGNLLLKKDCIEQCYIDNMIKIVKEIGPYIVLLKGIALAHARPEHGSKAIGLSLITLDTPVEFGDELNDPVSLVFALSAIDNSSHIDLISEMGMMFEDESRIQRLMDCKTKDEILAFIDSVIGKNEIAS